MRDIEEAYGAGLRDFAENYAQELVEKSAQLLHLPIRWHFIGALQSNKIAGLLEKCPGLAAIHSVDSVKKLDMIAKKAEQLQRHVDVYLQVNVSLEASKSGFRMNAIDELSKAIACDSPFVKIRGLMCIGEEGHAQRDFTRLAQVREALKLDDLLLNMGMSDDFSEAIAAGSSVLRIGSSIFGKRA